MPDYNLREADVSALDDILSGTPKSVILISGPRYIFEPSVPLFYRLRIFIQPSTLISVYEHGTPFSHLFFQRLWKIRFSKASRATSNLHRPRELEFRIYCAVFNWRVSFYFYHLLFLSIFFWGEHFHFSTLRSKLSWTNSKIYRSALVDSLEKAIGFWPSFATINKIFMWIESALPSKTSTSHLHPKFTSIHWTLAISCSPYLSPSLTWSVFYSHLILWDLQSTKVVQLDNILWTLENSLKLISVMKRSERSPVIIFDRFHDLIYLLERVRVTILIHLVTSFPHC